MPLYSEVKVVAGSIVKGDVLHDDWSCTPACKSPLGPVEHLMALKLMIWLPGWLLEAPLATLLEA